MVRPTAIPPNLFQWTHSHVLKGICATSEGFKSLSESLCSCKSVACWSRPPEAPYTSLLRWSGVGGGFSSLVGKPRPLPAQSGSWPVSKWVIASPAGSRNASCPRNTRALLLGLKIPRAELLRRVNEEIRAIRGWGAGAAAAVRCAGQGLWLAWPGPFWCWRLNLKDFIQHPLLLFICLLPELVTMGILTAPGRGGFGKDWAASLDPFKKVFQARTVPSVLRRVPAQHQDWSLYPVARWNREHVWKWFWSATASILSRALLFHSKAIKHRTGWFLHCVVCICRFTGVSFLLGNDYALHMLSGREFGLLWCWGRFGGTSSAAASNWKEKPSSENMMQRARCDGIVLSIPNTLLRGKISLGSWPFVSAHGLLSRTSTSFIYEGCVTKSQSRGQVSWVICRPCQSIPDFGVKNSFLGWSCSYSNL